MLGPRDRTSFFDEQQRNRRATWRLSFFCGLTVTLMGLTISAIVTPALLFELAILSGIVNVFLPISPISSFILDNYGALIDNLGAGTAHPVRFASGLFALVAPGLAFTYLLWRWLYGIFMRYGVGGVLYSLGARPPIPNDMEEQQLVNIVQEMAIADGIAPPRVMLLDSVASNAAMIGASPETATMVVSRRMLDDLDRDETQGVLAQLIGSAGNGDLGIALKIISVFQTYGLLMTILMLPMSGNARRTFWELLKLSFTKSQKETGKAELVSQLLLRAATTDGMDDLNNFLDSDRDDIGFFRKAFIVARTMILFPLVLGMIFSYIVLLMVVLFLLGPLLAFTWRTRCYLADSTAVQLTRSPDGLARALVQLIDTGALIPGSQGVSHLFIVGAEAAKVRSTARMQREIMKMSQRTQTEPGMAPKIVAGKEMAQLLIAQSQADAALEAGTFEEKQGIVVSFHPSLSKRLKRLSALGARY